MTGQEKLERLTLVIYGKDKHTSLFCPTVSDEHKKLTPGTFDVIDNCVKKTS
jgi:hypothetical protein